MSSPFLEIVACIIVISNLLILSVRNYVYSLLFFIVELFGVFLILINLNLDFVAFLLLFSGLLITFLLFTVAPELFKSLNKTETVKNLNHQYFSGLFAATIGVVISTVLYLTFLKPSVYAKLLTINEVSQPSLIHRIGINLIENQVVLFNLFAVLILNTIICSTFLLRKEEDSSGSN